MKYTVYEIGEISHVETRQDLYEGDDVTKALAALFNASRPEGNLAQKWCHKVVMEVTGDI